MKGFSLSTLKLRVVSFFRRLVFTVWLSSSALVAHAEPGITPDTIVVGQNITLQDGKNEYGVAASQGIRLYFSMVNAAGGVHGRRILLRTLDDDNKGANAEANARKLVQDGAFILFGSIEGGPSSAVMKVASELKVPFFGPMAGSPVLRRPYQPAVFPVRAEHRDEFRALMAYGKSIGLKTVGFLHADSEVGKQHLENVRRISSELGMELTLTVPFKGNTDDTQLDEMVRQIGQAKPDLFINHGSADLYARLLRKAKAAELKTTFVGVNSGSYQIAKTLGPLAQGMVFAQVVPSPWERKREITREYQEAVRKAKMDMEFSYGSLEGYMTAKALVMALRATGKDLTRASFVKTLEDSSFDLGGVTVRYSPGNHEGSSFVDLSLVSRQGTFIH